MGKELPMPDINGYEHLVIHISNLGWCSSNGMGIQALSFTEIKSYIEITETSLTSEEVMIIRKMSQSYVRELNNKDPQAKPPHSPQ